MAWLQNQIYVKKQNTLTVLDLIAQCPWVSRTELSQLTEISPASITRIVSALSALELVAEGAPSNVLSRGRKPVGVSVRADGLYAVGVCVETGRLSLSIVDFSYKTIGTESMLLRTDVHYTPEALAGYASSMLARLRTALPVVDKRLRVAGVSVQGVVDSDKCVLLASDQLNWRDVNLHSLFSDAFGVPAWIENDVKACLMGERAKRALPRHEDAAYLMLGSGVGVAATSDGKLIRGLRNQAGEIEHLGDDTSLLPGDLLIHPLLAREIVARARASGLSVSDLEALMALWRAGNETARIMLNDTRRALKLAIQIIDCVYDPSHIILGGSTVHILYDVLSDVLADERISIGEDYEMACMTGAAIIAARQAVEKMLDESNA